MWICKKCGKENREDRIDCWVCSTHKDAPLVEDILISDALVEVEDSSGVMNPLPLTSETAEPVEAAPEVEITTPKKSGLQEVGLRLLMIAGIVGAILGAIAAVILMVIAAIANESFDVEFIEVIEVLFGGAGFGALGLITLGGANEDTRVARLVKIGAIVGGIFRFITLIRFGSIIFIIPEVIIGTIIGAFLAGLGGTIGVVLVLKIEQLRHEKLNNIAAWGIMLTIAILLASVYYLLGFWPTFPLMALLVLGGFILYQFVPGAITKIAAKITLTADESASTQIRRPDGAILGAVVGTVMGVTLG